MDFSKIYHDLFFLRQQIGLAVGDIDSVQQNAEYKRLCLEVN